MLRPFNVVSKSLDLVVHILGKFHRMFRVRFRVFQIVSYQFNYISNYPPTDGGVYFDHLEQFGISFKTFKKFCGIFCRSFCFPDCVISLNYISKDPPTHGEICFGIVFFFKKDSAECSAEDSVYSRLCHFFVA